MGRTLSVVVALAWFISLAPTCQAYTPTVTAAGIPVRWKMPFKFNLAGNPTNANGIDEQSFYAAVVRGLQRWQTASGGGVQFDYWQGTDPKIYEPDSDFNGLSSIYFASNARSDSHMSPSVLGVTQVWYSTDSGEVFEADTALNDRDFKFTTNPSDTSGSGSGNPRSALRNKVFIENVVTHELGHALGLSHSGELQATMLFMESPEQAHLGCDEQVAIRAIYPGPWSAGRGAIGGAVVDEAGKAIFGAHVLAISRRRGVALASALTDKSGNYRIDALEPGAYFLMVEPYYAGPQALPAFYSAMSTDVCGQGVMFGRSVLTDTLGYRATPVMVGGGTAAAPPLVARCNRSSGAAIAGTTASSSLASAPVVFDGSAGQSGFGVADKLSSSGSVYYRLHAVSGHLEVHGLSFSIYSPAHPMMQLLDAGGNAVPAETFDHVYTGDSGYVNYDTALIARGLAPGDYYVEAGGGSLTSTLYPAGIVSLDSVPFLVITGSVNESAPPLAAEVPFNARCRMDENFAAYTSPPGNPPRSNIQAEEKQTGFCSTVSGDQGGPGSGPGPGPGQIIGWFLPWVAMAAFARLAKARCVACAGRFQQLP